MLRSCDEKGIAMDIDRDYFLAEYFSSGIFKRPIVASFVPKLSGVLNLTDETIKHLM